MLETAGVSTMLAAGLDTAESRGLRAGMGLGTSASASAAADAESAEATTLAACAVDETTGWAAAGLATSACEDDTAAIAGPCDAYRRRCTVELSEQGCSS